MPTYDYRCSACDHEFEEFQSITAKPLRKCPACGKLQLKRLIGTGAGVIFKGSGFYETDYRSDSYKKAADAEKQPATTDSKSDSKKTETKTQATPAKSEAKPSKKASENAA